MNRSFWNKRIPTLFGLFLIIVGIAITSVLVKTGVIFTGHANPSDQPQNVAITNITATSFTVSYTTLDAAIGSVTYGKSVAMGQLTIDNRDQLPHTVSPHRTHIVTISRLTPRTTYYFSVISGQQTYTNNGTPYQITTAPELESLLPGNKSVTGMVLGPGESKATDVLVTVTLDHAQPVMTTPDQNGMYTLPLEKLRTSDLSSYYTIPEDASILLSFTDGTFSSRVSFSPKEGTTVPTVVLSKDYDFALNEIPVASQSALAKLQPVFSIVKPPPATQTSLQVVTPKKDQEFTDKQPLFQGNAPPGSTVDIIIHSDSVVQTQVITDANGNWSFRPQKPLSPGTHTITIQTRDALGIIKSITQSFTVFASGTQVNQSATPSATLTLSPSPSVAPTFSPSPVPSFSPSPSAGLTATPAPTFSPSPIPTLIPTAIPTFIPTVIPTKSPIPVTGPTSVMIAGIIGAISTGIGLLFLFLSRGGAS